jgi:hypothetical protein
MHGVGLGLLRFRNCDSLAMGKLKESRCPYCGAAPSAEVLDMEVDMSRALRSLALCFSLLMPPPPAWSGTPPFDAEEYLRFSASESSIAMESGAGELNWPENFTLEAWVYPTAPSPFGVIAGRVAANRGADPFYHVVLAFEGQDGLTPAFIQTTGQPGSYIDVRAPQAIPLNQWTHLAATRQGSELRLFVDGVAVASRPSPGPSNPSPGVPFAIGAGARADGTGPQCCGSSIVVRNVKIWSRGLSGAEVQSSAAADGVDSTSKCNTPADRTTSVRVSCSHSASLVWC